MVAMASAIQGLVALGQLAILIQHACIAGGTDEGTHRIEAVADGEGDDGSEQGQKAKLHQAVEAIR